MTPTSSQTAILLALSLLKGVGPAALRKVMQNSSGSQLLTESVAASVPQILKAMTDEDAWTMALEAAHKQLDQVERSGARILSPFDGDYPSLLKATKDDPCLLYVLGTLATDQDKSVAIIGTREPTMHGQLTAVRITQYFVEQGWSIVSGLALGCDGIAHQAALDRGGHTVAVLAHGLQMISPTKHRKLADSILNAGGALVSQYPFGQIVQKQQYVQRDRVQAALARGVVMIQSDVKGGSLYASRAALEYGRWLAVPFPTMQDRERLEPKIQANLLMADGVVEERTQLLRCSSIDLERLIILRSKDDYSVMLDKMSSYA